MVTNKKIIKQFHYMETQTLNHCEEYLDEIEQADDLDTLSDLVHAWVRGINSKEEAAIYILDRLDE